MMADNDHKHEWTPIDYAGSEAICRICGETAEDYAEWAQAEVERLRAENAALREIATPVAYGRIIDHGTVFGPMLFHVGTDWPALKAQARTLLGSADTGKE